MQLPFRSQEFQLGTGRQLYQYQMMKMEWESIGAYYWGSLHVSRKWGQMQDYHTVKVVIGKRPEAFYVHLDLWKAGKNVWTCCIWHDLTDMFNWVESTISVPTSVGLSKYRSIFLKLSFWYETFISNPASWRYFFSIVSFLSPTKPTPLWPVDFQRFHAMDLLESSKGLQPQSTRASFLRATLLVGRLRIDYKMFNGFFETRMWKWWNMISCCQRWLSFSVNAVRYEPPNAAGVISNK